IRAIVRIVSIVVLTLWFGQATAFAAALVVVDRCAQDCPEDDERGCDCPPDCGCCADCSHPAPAVPPATPRLEPAFPLFIEIACPDVARAQAFDEPGEILHVSKLHRA